MPLLYMRAARNYLPIIPHYPDSAHICTSTIHTYANLLLKKKKSQASLKALYEINHVLLKIALEMHSIRCWYSIGFIQGQQGKFMLNACYPVIRRESLIARLPQPAVFILSPEPAVSFLFIDRFYSVSLYFLCFLRQAPFSSPLGRLGTRLGVQQVIPPPEAT